MENYSIDNNIRIIREVFEQVSELEVDDIIEKSKYSANDILGSAKANSIYTMRGDKMSKITKYIANYLARNLVMLLIIDSDKVIEAIIKIDDVEYQDAVRGVNFYCEFQKRLMSEPDVNSKFELLVGVSYGMFVDCFEGDCTRSAHEKMNNMKLITKMINEIASTAGRSFPKYAECMPYLAQYAICKVLPVLTECMHRG